MDIDDITPHGEPGSLRFIRHLLDERVHIAGDVVEIGAGTWAIHGVVPVDGDVLVAEFDTLAAARAALAALDGEPA